ncbi:MAG: 2OG-Fe(II) oxygenase family protein [Actinomycetota bacterium]|nr:2OG-Fe(II) oxygenase family protein [Actinomycetota bacterium]
MIATVDLRSGDAAARLDDAIRRDGFVQLVGHGLDEAVGDALWAGMDELFALPREVKAHYVVDDPTANRGWRERGSEALSYSLGEASPPDLFESFNVGHDDRVAADTADLMAPTPWPGEAPSFTAAIRAYLAEMVRLSAHLDEVLGGLIGVDDLAARSGRGPDTMACIRYEREASDGEVLPGQQRMGAHSDYTTFTILRADPVPGLEILGNDGSWVPVIPEPGALLLNVGDVLAMWTNDTWPSTLHRVPPPPGNGAALRRSVAYFHYPDLDVEVAPLAAYAPNGSDYAPTTVRDHLAARLLGPKQHRPSTSTGTLAGRRI